jgi:hypothetical protein
MRWPVEKVNLSHGIFEIGVHINFHSFGGVRKSRLSEEVSVSLVDRAGRCT